MLKSEAVVIEKETTTAWWARYFIRGGRMGSLKKASISAIKKVGFSEQDQADLYTQAHDKATQGRVGLGRSSMPKKVAGARWEGKRTKLGSDSESEEEEEEEETTVEDGLEEEVTIVLPKKGKR